MISTVTHIKKILYIEANRDGTIGGSYYSLLYLIQGLKKSKYEPHVLFCQDNVLIPEFRKVTPHIYVNDFGPYVSAPIKSIRGFIAWPFRFTYEVIFKQFKLQKIINQIQPDLVHLSNGYAALHEWMLACSLNKIKVIAHDRGTRIPCSFETRYFVRLLDAIISVSNNYMENVTKQGLKVKRLKRVYNGLDVDKLSHHADPAVKTRLRGEFNVKDDSPIVGILGNIDRWKGQHVVLSAINMIKDKYRNIRCLIVGPVCRGSESYKCELDDYILRHRLEENIIFTGYRSDVADMLNIMDVLIHASIEPEPFGRVILEGMAAGKPIIGTNSGGTPEQIEDNITGKLVPMNDPDSMAEAIVFYLADMERAKAIGEKGRQRLISMFSIERMIKETEELYEEIFSE